MKGALFNLALGARGEIMAWGYLLRQGFKIREKNFHSKLGEIDIVAEKKGRLYFIEVKTRSGTEYGLPQEAVTREKQKRLARLAAGYLQKKKKMDSPASFAVISVLWQPPRDPEIRMIDNAFIVE